MRGRCRNLATVAQSTIDLVGSLALQTPGLLNVGLAGRLVLVHEVLNCVAAEPVGDLGELLAETVDRLLVHGGLGDQVRERHWYAVRSFALERTDRMSVKRREGGKDERSLGELIRTTS